MPTDKEAPGRAGTPVTADDYVTLDATALAELVSDKAVSPRELALEAIGRIEAGDGQINALVHRPFEEALDERPALRPRA
jgi:amidase